MTRSWRPLLFEQTWRQFGLFEEFKSRQPWGSQTLFFNILAVTTPSALHMGALAWKHDFTHISTGSGEAKASRRPQPPRQSLPIWICRGAPDTGREQPRGRAQAAWLHLSPVRHARSELRLFRRFQALEHIFLNSVFTLI